MWMCDRWLNFIYLWQCIINAVCFIPVYWFCSSSLSIAIGQLSNSDVTCGCSKTCHWALHALLAWLFITLLDDRSAFYEWTCCAARRHNIPPLPASWPLNFWPWKWWPSHVWRRATSMPILVFLSLYSPFRSDVCDKQRQTDVRRASYRLMSPPWSALWGGGIIIIIIIIDENKLKGYDAQSVQSGTGRLSCSRTALKRCTSVG